MLLNWNAWTTRRRQKNLVTLVGLAPHRHAAPSAELPCAKYRAALNLSGFRGSSLLRIPASPKRQGVKPALLMPLQPADDFSCSAAICSGVEMIFDFPLGLLSCGYHIRLTTSCSF